MLDPQLILTNPGIVKEAIVRKGVRGVTPNDVDKYVELSAQLKDLNQKIQNIRTRRNEIAFKLSKGVPADEKELLISEGKSIKTQLTSIEDTSRAVEAQMNSIASLFPGIPSNDTPLGKDSGDNIEVRVEGKKPEFDFTPKDHLTLLTDLGLLDTERGVKISGFRGYFLKGDLALLEWAVLSYAIQKLSSKGFVPIIPPTLVKEKVMFGAAQFPWGKPDSYEVGKPGVDNEGKEIIDSMYLIGTSEQSLMGMFTNEVVDVSKGPIRMAGISPCYRREIGSYSKDVKGIYRVHEFYKIEQIVIMEPDSEKADKVLSEILGNSEEILRDLGIHYRILSMCTGDMGEAQHKKFDIESWMPGKNAFGETHSASNMLDFQCRRNNIKVLLPNGEKVFAYSLNNTAIALPRFLIALVETYQTKDGNIQVPKPLVPFMGKELITKS